MKEFKVILPAEEIPLSATVSQTNGETTYTLKDQIHAWDENGGRREIRAYAGSVFLVDPYGEAFAVNSTTPLCWRTDREQLIAYLEGIGDDL